MAKINWKQKDYLSLGRAVSNFNKKINELQKEEKKLYLPEIKSYKELKSKIMTRNELNRIIKSLKSFSSEGAEEPIKIKTGDIITKWEQKELGKQINIAKRGLRATIKDLEKPFSSGFSRAQMGSEEYREAQANLSSLKKAEKIIKPSNYKKGEGKANYYKNILENMRHLKNLEIKRTGEFTRLKERIEKYGSLDYKYMKATIFRENFERALEESGAQNFSNYEVLKNKLGRIKNPENFYKFISQSNVLMDIFEYYKEGDGIVYGGFLTEEERFDYALSELGLI